MKHGWWQLKITGVDELSDLDREHISKLINEGYLEGEINQHIEYYYEDSEVEVFGRKYKTKLFFS